MQSNPELPIDITRVSNIDVCGVSYSLKVNNIFYTNGSHSAVKGLQALNQLPAHLQQSIIHNVQVNGLTIVLDDIQRPASYPLGQWGFLRNVRNAIQEQSLHLGGSINFNRYDGIFIKIASGNLTSQELASVLAHEAGGHHQWFDINYKIAQAKGYTIDTINNPADLCDPFYFRHRRINNLAMPRSCLNGYIIDVKNFLTRQGMKSVVDISFAGVQALPSPEYLVFRRPFEYFRNHLNVSLGSLPNISKRFSFNTELMQKYEQLLYRNEPAINTLVTDICKQYPSLEVNQVRGIIKQAAQTMREELVAHFIQAEAMYAGSMPLLAPNTTLVFNNILRSDVILVPHLGAPGMTINLGYQPRLYYPQTIPRNFGNLHLQDFLFLSRKFWSGGFKILNTAGFGLDLYHDYQLARKANINAPITYSLMSGTSRFAITSGFYYGLYSAMGSTGLALPLLGMIADASPDILKIHEVEVTGLDQIIKNMRLNGATLTEIKAAMDDYYLMHPYAHPEMCLAGYLQQSMRILNVPGHIDEPLGGILKSSTAYNRKRLINPTLCGESQVR